VQPIEKEEIKKAFYQMDSSIDLKKLKMLSAKREDFIFYLKKSGEIPKVISPRNSGFEDFKIEDFFPDYYKKYFFSSLEKAIDKNKLELFSYELIIDNRSRYYEMSIIPLSKSLTIVILRDITLKKSSMTYLKIIKKICENTDDGVLIFSKDGNYIKINNSFDKITGISSENIKTVDSYKNIFDDDIFEMIKSEEEQLRKKIFIQKKDGKKVAVWITINTVYAQNSGELYKVVILTDISELENSRKKLQFIATHDELTGLPNRRTLLKYLDKSVKESIEKKRVGAVCFIDLDNFKIINDTMGHQAGDLILKESSYRIKSLLKDGDIFGRLGGDEFLLIVRDIPRVDYLFKLAQKIIDVINKPFLINKIKNYISVSIGVSLFPYDSKDSKELVRFADMAMYRAKESGKNRYFFYSSELGNSLKRKGFIEKILKYALQNDGFYLEFQPQVDINTNRVVGFESLIRIKSSIARDISPKEFIKVAEESNLIFELGKWSIQRSIQQLYIWKQFYGVKKISLSINLSKRQLIDEELPLFVDGVLTQFNIDPSWIEFEVTESVILNSNDRIIKSIKRLKDMGCHISIDDFGTGTISLNTFKDKIVDKIKIDKSFIDDLVTDKGDRDIVKASIAMAKMMGLSIVAEGVEKEEQKRILSILGCNRIQGFFFSRPLKAEAVLNYVLEIDELPIDKSRGVWL